MTLSALIFWGVVGVLALLLTGALIAGWIIWANTRPESWEEW